MIVAVPLPVVAEIPVTTPVALPTSAIVGSLLAHVPPVTKSLNIVVEPSHTFGLPVIAAGNGFTLTTIVAAQPVVPVMVYEIVVVPTAMPVTRPAGLTLAVAGAVLLHVPPALASLSSVDNPTHTMGVPVIAAGAAYTFINAVTLQPLASV